MTKLYTPYQGENTGLDWSASDPTELVQTHEVVDRMDLDDTEDKENIASQIKAIREFLESQLGMTLCQEKTITAYWDTFAYKIPLPFGPITSVTSVTIVNRTSGAETALTVSTDYWVEGVKNKAVRMNTLWPGYGIKIVYVTSLTDPGMRELVRDAIISEATYWYRNLTEDDDVQYDIGKIAMKKLRHKKPL